MVDPTDHILGGLIAQKRESPAIVKVDPNRRDVRVGP